MAELALVLLIGLLGPLLALPRKFGVPVAVGELLAGVVFGASGLKIIDASSSNLQLLANIGFALVMMVAASHIDVGRFANRKILGQAARNVLASAGLALAVAYGIGQWTESNGLVLLFAVLLTSSSAAVVLPILQEVKGGKKQQVFLAQVTLADLLSVLLLPVVANSRRAVPVFVGVSVLLAVAAVAFVLLLWLGKTGRWKRLRKISVDRHFGLELRLSLILLLGLVLLAQNFGVTILIAGFGLGLAIGANGVPKRLARQLFAVSEGFFAPLFFVLLGASIDVWGALSSPQLLLLAGLLGVGAVLTHLVVIVFGQSARFAAMASAQLGVPAAAASIGVQNGLLSAGQAGAVMLGALITLLVSATAATGFTNKSA